MDLHHVAQVVQGVPPEAREATCLHLMWCAHVADKYLKKIGKVHPLWGDGSLRSVALADSKGAVRPDLSHDMLDCFALVSKVLAARGRAVLDR